MDPPQRRHRRAVSTPKNLPSISMIQPPSIAQTPSTRHASSPTTPDHPRPPRTASRIMISVKRSLTPSSSKHRNQDKYSPTGMYSTPEERMSPQARRPAQFMTPDERLVGSAPPTVEQIAMGLHVSRTPHLRPLGSSRHPYSRGTGSSPHVALPPPPPRSSMKKPSQSGSPTKTSTTLLSEGGQGQLKGPFGASSSTVTSVATSPSSGRSSKAFSFSKLRMGRFLPGSRSSSAPSSSILSTPVSSPRNSSSDFDVVQKKAVRFQADHEDEVNG